jgi:hypothetical protein
LIVLNIYRLPFYPFLLPKERRTPLFYAAQNGHKEVVALLLVRGANIDAIDRVNRKYKISIYWCCLRLRLLNYSIISRRPGGPLSMSPKSRRLQLSFKKRKSASNREKGFSVMLMGLKLKMMETRGWVAVELRWRTASVIAMGGL